MCHEITAKLPCAPSTVPAARSFVVDLLGEWGATSPDVAHDLVADVELVVSELVGNAVKFCAGDFVLHLETHRDRIKVAVTDDNSAPAVLKRQDPLAPGGRGLFLVDALTTSWGQQFDDGHKTVWAQLSLPSGSALANGCPPPTSEWPSLTWQPATERPASAGR